MAGATVNISHPSRVRVECAQASFSQVSFKQTRIIQDKEGGASLKESQQQLSTQTTLTFL